MNNSRLMDIKDEMSQASVEQLEDMIEFLNVVRDIRLADINDTVDWIDKQRRKHSGTDPDWKPADIAVHYPIRTGERDASR